WHAPSQVLTRAPRHSTPSPSTTLFRSALPARKAGRARRGPGAGPARPRALAAPGRTAAARLPRGRRPARRGPPPPAGRAPPLPRSEEHTSELQSRENLVCRLLLEEKNL